MPSPESPPTQSTARAGSSSAHVSPASQRRARKNLLRSRIVPIQLGNRSYSILIGQSVMDDASAWSGLGQGQLAVLVTNQTVAPLYADRLETAIKARFDRCVRIELPDGEQHKNFDSLGRVYEALLAAGADRDTCLFALGGGVIGDLTGFAASTYMRGIPFVQVPTTLLAQVDSSVGGKTAVNHRLGKNMLGSFYQPQLVIADLDTLQTLPAREFSTGLAEVIKYGPVMDAEFLAWMEAHMDALLARDADSLAFAVQRSCELKAQVVGSDERERGQRAILNFGHTFGHAIETGLGYGVWLHGEAVACGMVMALTLSKRLGLIDDAYVQRVTRLIERAGLPTRGPALPVDRYIELMRHDKKAVQGELRFVVIESNGRAGVRGANVDVVRDVIGSCS